MGKYVREKLKVLQQLGIEVSPNQRVHFQQLHTITEVNNYFKDIVVPVLEPEPQIRVWCGNI